jgi:peroxiredoxin
MRHIALVLLFSSGCTSTEAPTEVDTDTNDADTDDADTDDTDTDDADTVDPGTDTQADCALTAGRCAPNFVLPDETDADFALSDLEGSRVLVMGNAMWCPPCNNLAEDVNQWASSADAPNDLEVLIVIVEDNGGDLPDASDVARFKQGLDLTVNVVADEDAQWIQSWGNTRYSYTTLDAEGTVSWHTTGYQSFATLTGQIQAIP